MSQADGARERLVELYRRKARHYDVMARLSPVPGYPQQTQRKRAVRALALRRGARVVDVACGTGLNFALIEKLIGPEGHLVGVDLTDAMLARARRRVDAHGWHNVTLVQADAAEFEFPPAVDGILCTYALTQLPGCAAVVAHGAAALGGRGRWVVLDLKVPARVPRWLVRLGTAPARPFAAIDEWVAHRPWEAIDAALRENLAEVSWRELSLGTAFLAVGSHRTDRHASVT